MLCVIDMVEVSSANTLGFSLHMVGFIMLIPRPSYRLFGGHRHLFYLKPDLQIIWYIIIYPGIHVFCEVVIIDLTYLHTKLRHGFAYWCGISPKIIIATHLNIIWSYKMRIECNFQGPVSISDKTSYHKISWSYVSTARYLYLEWSHRSGI